MSTFDDILYKAKTVVVVAGEKTGEFIELTKLRMNAAQKEKEITMSLEGMGRLVYEANKSGLDADELLDVCIERVDTLTAELEGLREKINRCKGLVICAGCGVANAEDACFCKRCGVPL